MVITCLKTGRFWIALSSKYLYRCKIPDTLRLFVVCHERVQSIESVTMTIQSKIPSVFNQNL